MSPWAAVSLLLLSLTSVSLSSPVAPQSTAGAPIILGNDDGWAEANIRALYNVLKGAGYDPLISAPAFNESGHGILTSTPKQLKSNGEFNTIPIGAHAYGYNRSDDHQWYVNGYPSDAIHYGLSTLSDKFFGFAPALVLTGPNVGSNLGAVTLISGTIGAAAEAASMGVPAIAFSGATGGQRSYTTLVDGDYSYIYAEGALRLTRAVLESGAPYLPAHMVLNVNFPGAGPGTDCASAKDFKFVMTRLYDVEGIFSDACTCGRCTLPAERDVVGTKGCYASVSVLSSRTMIGGSKAQQQTVIDKLKGTLTCLPVGWKD